MTKLVGARVRAVRIALLGATALALLTTPFFAGQAAAKVGVTSATDGDPLGKPPQEAERVLRIGVDVQANELISTSANDGTYQNAWNFGNRNGVATIKIDNTTYGGGSSRNVFLSGHGPVFSSNGALPSTSGPAGRAAAAAGAFVSSPGNPASQQIGGVAFTGPNGYNGIGVFSGTK